MSSVILNDGMKVKGSFGKEINVPVLVQFVEGKCIENCTSTDSIRFGLNEENINTIIARPHLFDEPPPLLDSRLTDEFRYKPLLRGMNETPSKGDPVLLCSIGDNRYYLGPLNTDNNVNYNVDNKSNNTVSDSVNFVKQVSRRRLHKLQNDDLDNPEGGWEQNNRSPIENHGDFMIEGRHGNSIRVGSRFKNPYIFISNEQNEFNKAESLGDGSLISITSKGPLSQHFGGYDDTINGVTFDRFELSSDTIQDNPRTIGNLVADVNQVDNSTGLIQDFGKGNNENQILINSDRITMNTKKDDIFISSLKDIHIGTGRTMTISNNQDLIIESNNTFLGNPNPNNTSREMEPMILGNVLLDIFRELLAELKGANAFVQGVPIPLIDSQQTPLLAKIEPLEQKLTTILSQHHFIEPNR